LPSHTGTAGAPEHALAELELVVAIYDNTLGPQHPDTLGAPRGQTAAPATRPAMRPQARPSHPQAPDGPAMELRAADPAMRTRWARRRLVRTAPSV